MRISQIILLITLFVSSTIFSQEKKTLTIQKTTIAPKIDGVLDDEAWINADEAKDFTQFRPTMGIPEKAHQKTIVKMTYDDNAIYIAAYLHDKPEDIQRQFTNRDNFGQSDFFAVIINSNNDAQNDIEFIVLSSGTQADAVSSPENGRDFGWNAVWDSALKIVDDGWIVEMKIPYSALRFSNQEDATWGLQFQREFRTDRSRYSWNPIDRTKGNVGIYHGELKGLKNIKPPVRLSLYPFASTVISSFDGETTDEYKLGLDIKYGLSENFTLDATLIPDFSQAGFDNLTLNLGPFEQTFSEQRQFFKEGVDLFNKGNLFFSRRVGSAPTGSVTLEDNEIVTDFPREVKTLNAMKVSGRTKKGLGIGFFNAITAKTEANIKNTITEQTRKEVVEPIANYNIIVIDQQFNQNSSVSIVNTNVTRDGSFRDANV
ncbi:MAG: carbohydrate binding family 9 domain-containing protein, partial [Chlorobi bacterium]|nr:carbohydrate binding family 9 domain-containing protein [Chlorobiota bacterium]